MSKAVDELISLRYPLKRAGTVLRYERYLGVIVVLVLTFLLSASCGEAIEVQRAAFTAWNDPVQKTLTLQTDIVLEATRVLSSYAEASITAYAAYGFVSDARQILIGLWDTAESYLPKELSAKHQQQLRDALAAFRRGEDCRSAALSALMAFFDSPSPSKLQQFDDQLKAADPHYVTGQQILKTVKSELGL